MKTLRFFLVMAAMLLAASNADAQNTMRVHQKDGTVHKFSITNVDFVDWCDEEVPEGEDTPGNTETEFEDITVNGHTYHLGVSGAVDLGLSVKWATTNVGASSPGDYGDYYAWGETETYYTEGHSQDNPCNSWRDGKTGYDWASCFDSNDDKYATNKKTKLYLDDDVAHVKWGGSWRMPTKAEQYDLRTKCTWVWTTYGGHNGYVVMGSTGNAIFLPAAGYRLDSSLGSAGSNGWYWSSSLDEGYSYFAWGMYFDSGDVCRSSFVRYYGQSVRPVCP